MIYVIDDNRYNQMSLNYRVDYTKRLKEDRYRGKVEWVTKVDSTNLTEIIRKASCLLIHDSMDEKDHKEKLLELAKDKKIPYCIFSNGFVATRFEGNSITSIKKDRLYGNLLQFIEHFKNEKKIDLSILDLGTNYAFEKAGILRDSIMAVLAANKKDFNYELVFPSKSEPYKALYDLHSLANLPSDFSDFESQLNRPGVTAEEVRQEVLRISRLVKSGA